MDTWEDFSDFIKDTSFKDCDEIVIDTVPSLKYHIYNEDGKPLCWYERAIEFDDYDSAHGFILRVEMLTGDTYEPYKIKEDILFYDSGYINLTNYIPEWRSEPKGDQLILVERKKS